MTRTGWFVAVLASCLAASTWQAPAGAATIAAVSMVHDVTNFSPTGLGIGDSGYWFANFNAPAPATNAPVPQNAADALPPWLTVNFDAASAAYSFPADNGDGKPYAVTNGGLSEYNALTLPDGSTGRSGQLVDVRLTTGGTDTLIKDLTFGPGAPASVLFHVVLDNAPLSAATAVDRVRATYRLPEDGNTIVRALFENAQVVNNGVADVYTFRLDGIEPTGYLAIQLRATGSNVAAGMAGFAFDAVPEPRPAILLSIGVAGLLTVVRRGRRRVILPARGW